MNSFTIASSLLLVVGTTAELSRTQASEHIQLMILGVALLALSGALRLGARSETPDSL